MTTDEMLDAKLAEGIELLNRVLIRNVSELWTAAGDLAERPRIREIVDAEHERMQRRHAEAVATLEAALLREAGRLH